MLPDGGIEMIRRCLAIVAQCQAEDWPDKDRRCVLDAATLAGASTCGIE
jgi:hypothetical protein